MNTYRKILLFVGDAACFLLGFCLFIIVAFNPSGFKAAIGLHAIPMTILVMVWIVVLFIFNFYDIHASKPTMVFLRNFIIAAIIMVGIGFIFFYINPSTQIAPKTNLLLFAGMSLALILAWRRLFYLATISSFRTTFAIVCADERHQTLIDQIERTPQLGLICVGIYKTLTEFYEHTKPVNLLIVHRTAVVESELLERVLASHIDVIDLAEAYEKILYKIPVNFINTHWIIHSIKKQSDMFYAFLSRVVSVIFAILVILATSPVLAITAIAIKLEDRGPILIKQERVGKHGKVFNLYKFRSMIVLNANGLAETGTSVWSPGAHDPRITKVGKITRRLHIDELAQMINVLRGDLTLVGPRPERPDFVAELEKQIPFYFMRHTINPGFTGWAQIKFRYARSIMDSEEKFEYDLFYIKNRNIFLDLGIILKTVQIIFTH